MRRIITNRWYDSVVHLDNEDPSLEIRIRTNLQPYEPDGGEETYEREDSGGNTHETRIVSWSSDDWEEWKEDLERIVEREWSYSLWIVPENGPIAFPGDNRRAFPNIRCRLNLHLVNSNENPHLAVTCRKIHPDDHFFRSSMGGPGRSRLRPCWERFTRGIREFVSGEYEANHGDLDNLDIEPKSSGQIPAVHEFGHYIGLSHVLCASNAPRCYGEEGTWAHGDLMGGGTRIEAWHGRPWMRRFPRHFVRWTRFFDFRVTAGRPAPQRAPAGGFTSPPRRRLRPGGMPDGGI